MASINYLVKHGYLNANLTGISAGITMVSNGITGSTSEPTPLTKRNVVNTGNAGKIGSSMSNQVGFTFPSTEFI